MRYLVGLFGLGLSITLFLFFLSCDREWNNPYDINSTLNKNDWEPDAFSYEVHTYTKITLSWEHNDYAVDEFVVERWKNGVLLDHRIKAFTGFRQYQLTDNQVEPSNNEYKYVLFARAGENTSSRKELSFLANNIIRPTIGKVIEVHKNLGVKIEWTYPSELHEAFLISRIDDNENTWTEFGPLSKDTRHFTDSTARPGTIGYKYRLFAMAGDFQSIPDEAEIALPRVRTLMEVDYNTPNQATASGEIISQGSSEVIEHGMIWSTSPILHIDYLPGGNRFQRNGNRDGVFSIPMGPLFPPTVYYYRAYAKNEQGVGYGESRSYQHLIPD